VRALESALKALLDPIYISGALPFRRPCKTDFEIEINITVKGTLDVGMTERQREVAEWKEKEKSWKTEEMSGYR